MRVRVNDPDAGRRLSPRQSSIVGLLSDGHTAKEIAILLGISPRTVREHVETAKQTAAAGNTTALVATAIRQKWIA